MADDAMAAGDPGEVVGRNLDAHLENEDAEGGGPAADEAEEANGNEEEDGKPEEEGSGDDLQDSSEEEEEGQNDYDLDDKFLVADEEASEEGDGEEGEGGEERRRRKRKRRRQEEQLDEEDYEIAGLMPPRPAEQRRRIRKGSEAAPTPSKVSNVERLREDLFGPDNEGLEDEDEEAQAGAAGDRGGPSRRDMDEFDNVDVEEDEFADFLDYDEEGGPPGEGRRRQRTRIVGLPPGVSSAALQDAQEIFGDVGGLLEQYENRRRGGGDGDLDEDEDEFGEGAEGREEDEDAAEERHRLQEERERAKALKKVNATVEPEVMARAMLRPEDDAIRATDIPEREQLRSAPAPEAADHDECARWIYERLVGGKATHAKLETRLLLEGRREVEGPPPDGRARWGRDELREDLQDCSRGQRGIRESRSSTAQEAWKEDEAAQEVVRASIRAVLVELFDKHNEIPFIATYRKAAVGELLCMRGEDRPDYTTNDREERRRRDKRQTDMQDGVVQARHRRVRRWEVLWAVQSLALRWRALARRKEVRGRSLQEAMDRLEGANEEAVAGQRMALDRLLEALQDADTPEEVADVDGKYALISAVAEISEGVAGMAVDEGATRRPRRSNAYTAFRRAGLDSVVRDMYISAEQLGENVDGTYRRYEAQDFTVPPLQYAAEHVVPNSPFDQPEKVLHGASQMAVAELAAEPRVRDFVRDVFQETAVISTDPTQAGEAVLDAFHPYGRVKRLRNRPVHAFEGDDLWLRVAAAEKESLISVRIQVPEARLEDRLMKSLREFYLSTAVSRVAQAWNAIREATLREAVVGRLLPNLEAELRARLARSAREAALHDVQDKLWGWAKRAPLQVTLRDEESVYVERRRFMAVCWGPGDPATAIAMLDEAGQLVDVLFAGQFSGLIRRRRDDEAAFADPAKARDAARIRDFILEHRPHVILVGGANLNCRQLLAELVVIRDNILETQPKFFTTSETGDVDIVYADEALAALWETSAAAKQELADQLPIVRRAVALGRCSLDPLPVLASLCGPSGEILAMGLHPLKALLPRADLLAAAERVCITAVNQVGVDINRVAHSAWQSMQLQFVSGLGPRKAQALLRAAAREEGVASRYVLWNELRVLGRCVFRNCGGFIRVELDAENPAAGAELGEVEALDRTRIHPTAYDTAKRLALCALNGVAAGLAEEDSEEKDAAPERAMEQPRRVEALNLVELNTALVAEGQPDNLPLLVDIAFELLEPFGEVREAPERLTEEQAFWLLTGETPETLRPGRRVDAIVLSAGRDDARCRLPDYADLDGLIRRSDVSSSGEVAPGDRMGRGDTVAARVKSVMVREWMVELTTASSDLNDDRRWEEEYCAKADKWYYMLSQEEIAREATAKARSGRSKQFVSRPIRHPQYKNVSGVQAAELLRDADVGSVLLRPSKGTRSIMITIKLHRFDATAGGADMLLSQEIMEGPKEAGGASHLQLGRPLSITTTATGRQEFEDLDEIIARYAEPLVANFRSITRHRKYREGPWEDLKEVLLDDKRRNPGGVPYCLGCRHETPGYFYLGAILSRTPYRETFQATNEGFYYRHEPMKTVEHIIKVFKEKPVPPGKEIMQALPPNQAPPAPNPAWQQQQLPPAPPLPYQQPMGMPPQAAYGAYGASMQPPAQPYRAGTVGDQSGW